VYTNKILLRICVYKLI